MTGRARERLLWGMTLVVAVAGAVAWRRAAPAPAGHASLLASAPPAPAIDGDKVNEAAQTLVARDLFRLARHPSPVSFVVAGEGLPAPPPRPPKPALVLVGIVAGARRTALVEGVPGREGSVLLAAGDTAGGLRIRTITRDTVIIAGMDTTWRLGVRRAW